MFFLLKFVMAKIGIAGDVAPGGWNILGDFECFIRIIVGQSTRIEGLKLVSYVMLI